MPIYEFYCPGNHRIYSFYARSLAYAARVPRCPDDAALPMQRMISKFAITGRAKEKPEMPAGADLDDSQMESMMAEMEREFSGMDEQNPDPKMLGRMMRKMSELSGQKVPGELEEMVRRMEAGENPEKLEEEFGDAMGNLESLLGDSAGGENLAGDKLRARLRALTREPQRDPVLYEMSDFLEAPPAPAKRAARR